MPHLSWVMYDVARRLAVEAGEGKWVPEIGAPIASVILAVTGLEAFVNEELEMAPSPVLAAAATLRKARGRSLMEKWRAFLSLRVGKEFKRGEEPCQSLALLCELRNHLVHDASQFVVVGDLPKAQIKALSSRFPFTPGAMTWEQQVLNAACARWACNTAARMREEHARILGQPEGYRWEPIQ